MSKSGQGIIPLAEENASLHGPVCDTVLPRKFADVETSDDIVNFARVG